MQNLIPQKFRHDVEENTEIIKSDQLCADPTLSVCVVTYNHHNYIRQTLDSILMQETEFSE